MCIAAPRFRVVGPRELDRILMGSKSSTISSAHRGKNPSEIGAAGTVAMSLVSDFRARI